VELMGVPRRALPRRSPCPRPGDHRQMAPEVDPRAGRRALTGRGAGGQRLPPVGQAVAHVPLDQRLHQQGDHGQAAQDGHACRGLQADGGDGGRGFGPLAAQFRPGLSCIRPQPRRIRAVVDRQPMGHQDTPALTRRPQATRLGGLLHLPGDAPALALGTPGIRGRTAACRPLGPHAALTVSVRCWRGKCSPRRHHVAAWWASVSQAKGRRCHCRCRSASLLPAFCWAAAHRSALALASGVDSTTSQRRGNSCTSPAVVCQRSGRSTEAPRSCAISPWRRPGRAHRRGRALSSGASTKACRRPTVCGTRVTQPNRCAARAMVSPAQT
jgi:hypothetical protein